MDHHSHGQQVIPNQVLGNRFSFGGSLFLVIALGLIGQENGFYIFLLIIAIIFGLVRICKRCSDSGYSTEESATESISAQSPIRSSIIDVENQPSPRSLGPMNKYPTTCPSCGKDLEEDILKKLIISDQTKCIFCGSEILTSKKS